MSDIENLQMVYENIRNYRYPYTVPEDRALELMKDAMKLSSIIKVDELDCSKSFARTRSDKSAEEVLSIAYGEKDNAHSVFIYRDGRFEMDNLPYYDVGVSTKKGCPDYYIFLKLSEDDGKKLIDKFDLRPII